MKTQRRKQIRVVAPNGMFYVRGGIFNAVWTTAEDRARAFATDATANAVVTALSGRINVQAQLV